MVIRRIRDHVGSQNWFAVLIDLAIVVVGVFVGQQVSNWNSDRLEHRQAAEYRGRLVGELDFDARQYAVQAAYYRQAQAYGLAALADLRGTKPLADRDFVIAAYQLTQSDSTRAKTGVFDEMTARGLTDRLGDSETQELASDFYLSVDVAQRNNEATLPYRSLLREWMPYDLQADIREQCGDRAIYYRQRLVGVRLVVPCPMTIDAARAADAARAVRAGPDIEKQMTRYIAGLDEKVATFDIARAQSEAFRDRLHRP